MSPQRVVRACLLIVVDTLQHRYCLTACPGAQCSWKPSGISPLTPLQAAVSLGSSTLFVSQHTALCLPFCFTIPPPA